MRKFYYPIALRLEGARALVVGGGKIAERKAKALFKAGAKVRVVSPDATAHLIGLERSGKIAWRRRAVRYSDIKGADIIIAATSDAKVNKKVSRWAKRKKVLANVVDNVRLSSFISPAVFSAGGAVVAVNTNGEDPVLSRDLKNFLKEKWDVFLSYRDRL